MLAGTNRRAAVGPHSYIASGGYEYDGRKIANLDEEEIAELCRGMSGEVDAVAVCGVFAPVNREQEKRVGEIVREVLGPDMPVTYSSEIGKDRIAGAGECLRAECGAAASHCGRGARI